MASQHYIISCDAIKHKELACHLCLVPVRHDVGPDLMVDVAAHDDSDGDVPCHHQSLMELYHTITIGR